MRLVVYSLAGCLLCSTAVAKYCVKLPTCEELGYIYSADKYPNNRSIKCPFDTKKILLLDYCQAYGLTSCDSTSGECDECIVEKADGTKSNSGYWRYTRCNAGYSYKSGECPPTEVDTSKYPFTQGELNEEIGEIECVQSGQNIYCGYKSCNDGWYLNSGNCIVHDCGSSYPYTSCDANGTCEECKSGTNTKYGEVTCNLGYYHIENTCHLPCLTAGACKIGDIYAYNSSPIGIVFYNDTTTTKIIALTDIDEAGDTTDKLTAIEWTGSSYEPYSWSSGATRADYEDTAKNDKNGKNNTKKILSYITTNTLPAEAAISTSLYAPITCEIGSICAKGNWYLPSAGELYSISSNWINNGKIYAGISVCGGKQFIENYYWSSTEGYTDAAWVTHIVNNHIGLHRRYIGYNVRPALHLCAEGYYNIDGICQ